MRENWEAPRIIANVARTVDRARAAKAPVIWVQHSDDELVRGSPEWQCVPQLIRTADEPLVDKHFNSAFEQTALEDHLARFGATHIVLAGAATNWCVRATAYGALDRGYDLTLIEDAHTTSSMVLDDGVTTIEAETVILELNIAIKWLSYPDRTNQTITADEVDFGVATER